MEPTKVRSDLNLSKKEYNPYRTIRILNPLQAAVYWNNGLIPLDIYPSKDFKTQKPIIIYVFDKEATKEIWDIWCRKENK